MTIQLHKCAHFVFCIKNRQNFVDLDAFKKPEVKKFINKFFWSDLNHDLNQMI